MREDKEDFTITEKKGLDVDEILKKEELLGLRFLAQVILYPNSAANGDKKIQAANINGEASFNAELSSIDEKVKTECAKIYRGNYAKFLNTTDKMTDSLIPFLKDIRN